MVLSLTRELFFLGEKCRETGPIKTTLGLKGPTASRELRELLLVSACARQGLTSGPGPFGRAGGQVAGLRPQASKHPGVLRAGSWGSDSRTCCFAGQWFCLPCEAHAQEGAGSGRWTSDDRRRARPHRHAVPASDSLVASSE